MNNGDSQRVRVNLLVLEGNKARQKKQKKKKICVLLKMHMLLERHQLALGTIVDSAIFSVFSVHITSPDQRSGARSNKNICTSLRIGAKAAILG